MNTACHLSLQCAGGWAGKGKQFRCLFVSDSGCMHGYHHTIVRLQQSQGTTFNNPITIEQGNQPSQPKATYTVLWLVRHVQFCMSLCLAQQSCIVYCGTLADWEGVCWWCCFCSEGQMGRGVRLDKSHSPQDSCRYTYKSLEWHLWRVNAKYLVFHMLGCSVLHKRYKSLMYGHNAGQPVYTKYYRT